MIHMKVIITQPILGRDYVMLSFMHPRDLAHILMNPDNFHYIKSIEWIREKPCMKYFVENTETHEVYEAHQDKLILDVAMHLKVDRHLAKTKIELASIDHPLVINEKEQCWAEP